MVQKLKFCFILMVSVSRPEFSSGHHKTSTETPVPDEWDMHRSKQYYQSPIVGIGLIQPADLERILQSQLDFRYNDSKNINNTFWETIPRLIVPYERSVGKNDDKIMLLQTLTMVTEFNSRSPTGKRIEVMISISPKGSIADDLNEVFYIVNQTNSKLAGTVSTVLLQYGPLRLNSDAVHLVNQDIESCNHYAITYSNPSNVTCGFIIDARNCIAHETKFKRLRFTKKNLIIFDLTERTEDGFVVKLASMVDCLQAIFRKAPLGVKLPSSVTVDLKAGHYFRKPVLYKRTSEAFKYSIEKIELVDDKNMSQTINETSPRFHPITDEWLRRPVQLSKHHFGVTLHSLMVTALEVMMSEIFASFRIIILESPGGPSKAELHRHYDLVQKIASYAKKLVTMEGLPNKPNLFDDGIPVQIMLSVTLYHDNWDTNQRAVDTAFAAAVTANEIYPGIVKAVLFEWNSCLKSEFCEPITEPEAMKHYISKHFMLLESAVLYALELRNSTNLEYPLKLGIAFDKQLVYDSAFYYQGSEAYAHGAIFSQADLFVYKLNMDGSEIFEQGALGFTQSLLPKLFPLKATMETVLKILRLPIPPATIFYMRVGGCGKGTENDRESDKLTEAAEYARFWEIIANWAVVENTTVIIDTAFEEGEHLPRRSCRFDRNPFKGVKGCACGWWRVSKGNISQDSPGGDGGGQEVILTDKKTVAIQLHSKAKLSQNYTPPQEKYDFWGILKLLVPAVMLVLVVGLLAAWLGRYHNRKMYSNVVLSKTDLKSFFRGEASPRNESGHDLILSTSNHPDSQPYNKEKYELASSLFKVGTRFLGQGEFGAVVNGFIIRADEEKEVAVKMINKRANSGVDQSHGRYLALKGLASEVKLLSFVGEHEHIVKLEGAYTAKLKKGTIFAFLEYCELGSLEKYLHSCVSNIEACVSSNEMSGSLSPELSNDLYRWVGEIACGMEFLASKNVVHADLAARNVLLTSGKCAKISDFGLSRRLYDYTEYLKTEQGPLPWRWMSPESLRKLIFNEKSDVWSFGVILWEMYTLGDIPYSGLSWEINFAASLEVGVRLPEPRFNEKNIYSVMKRCWGIIPYDRPTFAELNELLNKPNETP